MLAVLAVAGLWAAPARLAAAAASTAAFLAGCVLFLSAYAIGVARSREQEVSVAGLFLAAGAPQPARVRLLGLVGVQTAVGLAVAIARPFSPLAFVLLAPMFGLAVTALWAARHQQFPPRAPRRRAAKAP
ncbi:MAG: hypothetical protein ACKVWR_02175 [Acidimicrobiales bacterium]